MIGINKDLRLRENLGKHIRVGLIGTGQMGTDIIAQTQMMRGIKVVAAADVDGEKAINAFAIGLVDEEVVPVQNPDHADEAVSEGKRIVTTDYRVVTDMKLVDVIIEATGVPEIGALVALRSALAGHHIAMLNVETDITVGPLLQWYCKQKGVLYTLAAGDEPAACKELYDFADALGFTVVVVGKGKNNPLERHAAPTNKRWVSEAARRGLTPRMLIEFVDGTKTMIEMAAVSNSTGLVPDVRGMHGPLTHREILHRTFALKKDGGILNKPGVVDYAVGKVAPGVFAVVRTEHPRLREALVLRDMGPGPYYTLFRPYHLCSIEAPLSCALLVIQKRPNMVPGNKLVAEVFAVAKRDLQMGEELDGIGGTTFYGLIDVYEAAASERLLPVGLAKGARMRRRVLVDTPITYDDVELMEESTILRLRRMQDSWQEGNIKEDSLELQLDMLAKT